MENYYTIDKLAKKMQVHEKTIRRYIYGGKIEAIKVGGQWRISEEAVNNYYKRSKNCCNSDEKISSNDFCVFMDGQNILNEGNVQFCTIIDYYEESKDKITEAINCITKIIVDSNDNKKYRFEYTFDEVDQKARFVLWGDSIFIEKVSRKIREFEE